MAISLGACAPMPLANWSPPTVSVPPSPADCSPLLMLRSAGPQPLVSLTHGTSPRYEVPAASGPTAVAVPRQLISPVTGAARPAQGYEVVAASSYGRGAVPAGAVTCQRTVYDRPGPSSGWSARVSPRTS